MRVQRWSGPGRAERGRAWLEGTLRDIRYAARALRREPLFAAGVILTMALGIGANAAMFGLLDRLLLRPPPHVRDAGRVVRLGIQHTSADGRAYTMGTTSYVVFDELRTLARAFDGVAAARADEMTLGAGRVPRRRK
jgi:hypothetical protein